MTLVLKEIRVLPELQVHRGLRVFKELQDHKVLRDRQDQLVKMLSLFNLVHLVPLKSGSYGRQHLVNQSKDGTVQVGSPIIFP